MTTPLDEWQKSAERKTTDTEEKLKKMEEEMTILKASIFEKSMKITQLEEKQNSCKKLIEEMKKEKMGTAASSAGAKQSSIAVNDEEGGDPRMIKVYGFKDYVQSETIKARIEELMTNELQVRAEYIQEIRVPPGRAVQGTIILSDAEARDPILDKWRAIPESQRPKFRTNVLTLGKDNSLPRKRRTAKFHSGCERLQQILGDRYQVEILSAIFKVTIGETMIAQTPYGEEEFQLMQDGLRKVLSQEDMANLLQQWS